jgi:hypothetical protein
MMTQISKRADGKWSVELPRIEGDAREIKRALDAISREVERLEKEEGYRKQGFVTLRCDGFYGDIDDDEDELQLDDDITIEYEVPLSWVNTIQVERELDTLYETVQLLKDNVSAYIRAKKEGVIIREEDWGK